MVEGAPALDAVFHALAHDARRDMLRRLAAGELTVGELAAPLQMSLAAASKHVKVLEQAGLVQRTVTGRRHLCRLRPGPLSDAAAWLRFAERFWDERLDSLQDVLEQATALDEEAQHAVRHRSLPDDQA
ncbi:ArsR/SmtB family transcription factor [Kitasatospora sp. NPDC048365]|uniref:ArsR/SmtB family transcription factor n=1 Tax=Kitasatospora sp. NPDC048365 TaxID=3364050 RepID=UPI00371AF1A3